MLGTILIVILILFLIGAFLPGLIAKVGAMPRVVVLGTILIVVLILFLLGRL